MKLWLIVFLLLLPLAFSYSVDQNKLAIVAGIGVSSSSYEMRVAVDQMTIGESSSNNYITQVGWIYTLLGVPGVTINVIIPEPDANINSNPTITFDVNTNSGSDINAESIVVDLNGTESIDFDYSEDCTEFSGEFYCSYVETDLDQDADNNVSFRASNDANEVAFQVERIVHFDAIAPTVSNVSAVASGSNVVVSWDGNEFFTGIETFYVREIGTTWIRSGQSESYTFSGHASASHTYEVKAKDFADNNSLISQASYSAPSADVTPITPSIDITQGGAKPRPEAGIFDIQIVRIDDPVEVGDRFDFTYIVSNESWTSGNAYIEYWLESGGEKYVSGSETVYLLSGEEREISDNLLLLQDMQGQYEFYLRLTRLGQDPIVKKRVSQVMLGAPTVIDLNISSLEPGDEIQPVRFSIEVGSNRDETIPVLLEEKIYKDGKIVWEKKQTVPIKVFQRFVEEVHGLEIGKYSVEVYASYGDQEKRVEMVFEKKSREEVLPGLPPEAGPFVLFFLGILPWIIALILAIAAFFLARRLWKDRRKRKKGLGSFR